MPHELGDHEAERAHADDLRRVLALKCHHLQCAPMRLLLLLVLLLLFLLLRRLHVLLGVAKSGLREDRPLRL